jgi:sugar phosphate isomerase/epimerase
MSSQIKRGISIYSFQEKYYRGELTLEGCLATASQLGVRGFEMLADQMIPGYPSLRYNLSEEFVENWRGWLERYRVEPIAFDVYGETKLYKHRPVTHAELLSELRELLKTAQVLGFRIIRLTFHLPIEVIEALIPYAEEAGIRIALEVHAPLLLTGEWVQRNLDLAARKQTKHLGLMPDLGIFCKQIPGLVIDEALRDGATSRIAEFLRAAYHERPPRADLVSQVDAMGGNDADRWLAQRILIGVWTYHDPRHLLEYIPYTFHIHGKFYEIDADLVEHDVATSPCCRR